MTPLIDSDDYAASGIETMFFPGGEPHVKVPTFTGTVLAHLKIRTWSDCGFAALLLEALSWQRGVDVYAFVPYFPGARQDRSDGHSAMTLAIMGTLLDAHKGISVFDPHSDVALAYVNIRHVFMPDDLALATREDVVGIIAPDAGAVDRAERFRDFFYPGVALVECAKRRDSASGRLSGYAMPALPMRGRYIVVDDICDGGGTFNLLAQQFKADVKGAASKLELFVSHGIFSKGLDAIDPVYERITTTDSWCRLPDSERLTVLPLAGLLSRLTEKSNLRENASV